ncbi:hydroxymethylglutaryl-CoA lyase [Gaiella sp.]|uniref:hydroxymethylglutaryl-CoA lyase n=1 Tax=Gaiella sp. TaxID=2663207 RepID=UPI003262F850
MSAITLCDVGPRDGLQNRPEILSPHVRAELVERLAATGLPRIEAVSFVSASRVPQMAGAEEVVAGITPRAGVTVAGLVLNERGYDRLVAAGLREAHFSFSVSESFNRRNQGAGVEESLALATAVIGRAREAGISSTVTLSTAFGCPFEGPVDPGRVREIAARVVAAQPNELLLGDTIGVAVPRQVEDLVASVAGLGLPVGVHLHNTRNTGYANALAAIAAGATLLDASLGGIGGCPFAPRATGNIATEDLVYLLDGEGIETGVDLDALIGVAVWLEGILGEELEGQVYRAGRFPPPLL